jgi:hypothetical protein
VPARVSCPFAERSNTTTALASRPFVCTKTADDCFAAAPDADVATAATRANAAESRAYRRMRDRDIDPPSVEVSRCAGSVRRLPGARCRDARRLITVETGMAPTPLRNGDVRKL